MSDLYRAERTRVGGAALLIWKLALPSARTRIPCVQWHVARRRRLSSAVRGAKSAVGDMHRALDANNWPRTRHDKRIHSAPCLITELSSSLWLLIKGVDVPEWRRQGANQLA
jgi:hypothetical protein